MKVYDELDVALVQLTAAIHTGLRLVGELPTPEKDVDDDE